MFEKWNFRSCDFLSRQLLLLFLVTAQIGQILHASVFDLTEVEMQVVMNIAKRIHIVQPHLEEAKYLEYAIPIFRASSRYDIDPDILIAITQQETNFRENLNEGHAGEIGICQILKSWLQNPLFRKEFRSASIRDLKRPSKAFFYAAWILKELRLSYKGGALPYWSFYNSKNIESRFKYFLLVNRNLVAIRKMESTDLGKYAIIDLTAQKPPVFMGVRSVGERTLGTASPQVPNSPSIAAGKANRWRPDTLQDSSSVIEKKDSRKQGLPPPDGFRPRYAAPLPVIQIASDLGISTEWLMENTPREQ